MSKTYSLADLAAAFSEPGAPEESVAAFQKALKNLTQRTPLSAVARRGKADLYDLYGACAIRLTATLASLGVPNRNAHSYAVWLSTRVSDAVSRATAGEMFDHRAISAFDTLEFADVPKGDPETERGAKALKAAKDAGLISEDLAPRIVIPAAALIRDTLQRLGER